MLQLHPAYAYGFKGVFFQISVEYMNVIQIYAVPSDFSFIMHQNRQLLSNLLRAYKLQFSTSHH